MNETVQALVSAIAEGDAIATEQAFGAAMAEKLASRIDDLRTNIAQGMFSQMQPQPELAEEGYISEEEYLALSEEEQSQYELLDEASLKSLGKRAADLAASKASLHVGEGSRKQQAADKKNIHKIPKSISSSHGSETAKRADASGDDEGGHNVYGAGSFGDKHKVFVKKDLGGRGSKEHKTYINRMHKQGMHSTSGGSFEKQEKAIEKKLG